MRLTVCSQKALVKLKRSLPPVSTRRDYPRPPVRRLPRNRAAIVRTAFATPPATLAPTIPVHTVVATAMPCRTQIKRSEILQRTTREPKACNAPVLRLSCRPNPRRQAALPQHRPSQLRPSQDAIVNRASHSLVAAPRRRSHWHTPYSVFLTSPDENYGRKAHPVDRLS